MSADANLTNGSRSKALLKCALWYASKGFPVFPLVPRDKNPLTEHGFKDASTKEAQIRSWWTRWPDANVGVPTGAPSGWLVLDVDPRNGGDESLEALIAQHGRLPDSAGQITGGAGRHIVLRFPGLPVPKTLAPGIDLKGDGGYVVVAPSVHPSGRRYQWDGMAGAKALLNLADPPAWLLESIRRPEAKATTAPDAKIAQGQRNTTLVSLAGTMRRRGCAEATIRAALLEENRERCDPPLPEDEVRQIAASVGRYEPGLLTGRPTFRVEHVPPVWSFEARVCWAVEELIPESAVTLLTGDSGVGKSTLALALAAAVARGDRFLGRETCQRKVLYVDRENPLAGVKERLHRMGIGPTEELKVWGGWVDSPPPGPGAPSILEFSGEHKPLIVFDSLIAFHEGSEQDASETRRFLDQFRRLANLGATVLVVHHTGKADTAKTYRGSSDIKASVDCAYLLEPLGDVSSGLGRFRLNPFKNRLALSHPLLLESTGGGFDVCADSAAVETETSREFLEDVIRQNPGANQAALVALAREKGVARNRLLELLAEGARTGRLAVERGQRGQKVYSIPEVVCGEL